MNKFKLLETIVGYIIATLTIVALHFVVLGVFSLVISSTLRVFFGVTISNIDVGRITLIITTTFIIGVAYICKCICKCIKYFRKKGE